MESWYENYEHKSFEIKLNFRFHTIMDNFLMAIEDKYLNPSNKLNKLVLSEKLTKTWNLFYNDFSIASEHNLKKRLLISLSGGVDSMSTCFILKNWVHDKDIEIVALHIQYNNRAESQLESEYLQHWCCKLGIKLYIYNIKHIKRNTTNREQYEKETRDIRFKLYKIMMKDYEGGVILGHIKDDIFENIFRNISMNVNPFSISGMEKITYFNSCTLLRPFLDTDKKDIIKFADKFSIPYFCDTTPEWSMRGKFRNKLRPILHELYGPKVIDKFIDYTTKMQQFSDWFEIEYYDHYFESIEFNNDHILLPFQYTKILYSNIEHIETVPKLGSIFWDKVIDHICKLKNLKRPSSKCLEVLYNKIQYCCDNGYMYDEFKVEISKNMQARFECNKQSFKIYFLKDI